MLFHISGEKEGWNYEQETDKYCPADVKLCTEDVIFGFVKDECVSSRCHKYVHFIGS